MPSAPDSPEKRGAPQIDRRAVARVVRDTALTVYGVTRIAGGSLVNRLAARVGIAEDGIRVRTSPLEVQLSVELSPNVPREQVLANLRDALAYAVQRDFGQPVSSLDVSVREA